MSTVNSLPTTLALRKMNTCGAIAVSGLFLIVLSGCLDTDSQQGTSKKMPSQEVDILPMCRSIPELRGFFATQSLGGNIHVQEKGRLIFVQAFPYSGVLASHLYVYADEPAGLRFVAFLRLQTQEVVEVRVNADGSANIQFGNQKVGVLFQPTPTRPVESATGVNNTTHAERSDHWVGKGDKSNFVYAPIIGLIPILFGTIVALAVRGGKGLGHGGD